MQQLQRGWRDGVPDRPHPRAPCRRSADADRVSARMKRIVILISGRGSNMQALLEAGLAGRDLRRNQQRAAARRVGDRARLRREHGRRRPPQLSRSRELRPGAGDAIARHDPHLVVLAGFMRSPDAQLSSLASQAELINIHPSLLPAFPGNPYPPARARRGREDPRLHGALRDAQPRQWPDHRPGRGSGAAGRHRGDPGRERACSKSTACCREAVRWFLDGRLHVEGNHVAGRRPLPIP